MSERGAYRATFEALSDDLDFQELSFAAQAVFGSLKRKLGQYGIAVFYPAILYELHRKESPAAIDAALAELETPKPGRALGWIKRERNVTWIVNGLRYEPALSLANVNHASGARKYAGTLPRVGIVSEFLAYYGLAAIPSEPPKEAPAIPSRTHADGIPDALPMGGGITTVQGTGTETVQNTLKPADAGALTTTEGRSAPPKRTTHRVAKPKGEPAVWMATLTPVWRSVYGGVLPKGAATTFRPLVEEHGVEAVAAHLNVYVTRTPAQFASLPKFCQTFGAYAPGGTVETTTPGTVPALPGSASPDDLATRREAQALYDELRSREVAGMEASRAYGSLGSAVNRGLILPGVARRVYDAMYGTDSPDGRRNPPTDGGALRTALQQGRAGDAVRALETVLRAHHETAAVAA